MDDNSIVVPPTLGHSASAVAPKAESASSALSVSTDPDRATTLAVEEMTKINLDSEARSQPQPQTGTLSPQAPQSTVEGSISHQSKPTLPCGETAVQDFAYSTNGTGQVSNRARKVKLRRYFKYPEQTLRTCIRRIVQRRFEASFDDLSATYEEPPLKASDLSEPGPWPL